MIERGVIEERLGELVVEELEAIRGLEMLAEQQARVQGAIGAGQARLVRVRAGRDELERLLALPQRHEEGTKAQGEGAAGNGEGDGRGVLAEGS